MWIIICVAIHIPIVYIFRLNKWHVFLFLPVLGLVLGFCFIQTKSISRMVLLLCVYLSIYLLFHIFIHKHLVSRYFYFVCVCVYVMFLFRSRSIEFRIYTSECLTHVNTTCTQRHIENKQDGTEHTTTNKKKQK